MNHHLTAALAEARIADLRGAAIHRSPKTRRQALRVLGLRFGTARLPVHPVEDGSP